VTGMGPTWMFPAPAWLLLLCTLPMVGEAAFVRANCRGIQEFSLTDGQVSCQQSSVLEDDDNHLILGHTRASASLPRGLLQSSAAGGQIPGVGSNGGEAGALLMDRLTVSGAWTGSIAVTVLMCVRYRFAGLGESRIHATLRLSSVGATAGANQARIELLHRGFGGATLANSGSRGVFEIPVEGRRPAQSVFALRVSENIRRGGPELTLRADIASFALPNLQTLEPVLSSFGEVEAWVLVSVPEGLAFTSESGRFLDQARVREACV